MTTPATLTPTYCHITAFDSGPIQTDESKGDISTEKKHK